MSDPVKVRPEVLTEARDALMAIQLNQAGKAVNEDPIKGEYFLSMRPGMTFWGNADYVVKLLGRAFPGCSFTWR